MHENCKTQASRNGSLFYAKYPNCKLIRFSQPLNRIYLPVFLRFCALSPFRSCIRIANTINTPSNHLKIDLSISGLKYQKTRNALKPFERVPNGLKWFGMLSKIPQFPMNFRNLLTLFNIRNGSKGFIKGSKPIA